MKLPEMKPVKENVVVTSPSELIQDLKETVAQAGGAFLKIFGKRGSAKYYVTLLFDRSKLLAAEGQNIDSNESVVGSRAIELFREMLGGPLIVDVYSLDEIGVKLSIADNLEVYNSTPKISIEELFGGKTPGEVSRQEAVSQEKPRSAPQKEVKKEAPPKQSTSPTGEVEIVIEIPGGEVLKEALREYTKNLLEEAKRIRTLKIDKVVFSGDISEGVVYLNVHLYGHSEGAMREIAEKRMLHAISKYAPVILRIADMKPILKDVRVLLNGKEVAPKEIIERDKKKVGKVDKEGRVTLSVIEDVWPYFSAMVRTVLGDLQSSGIIVEGATFDIPGRREFEVNAKLVVKTSLPKEQARRVVRDIITRHTKELGRSIKRYITVHNIEVEFVESWEQRKTSVPLPKVASGKAAEILQKKAEIEKEVEKLLQQAGIDELAYLTEEKKRESEKALLRARIEPAMEALKNRLHTELKLIPRVTFKWLKMNWDATGTVVYVEIEASFMREDVGGLFGSFSSVDEKRLKEEARETILRVIRDVQKEFGIKISLNKLNVIVR